ncbi:Hypothetical protein D9617_22g066340 [Elsinoe fawcettii]|nr:Hypothetical protein D9617_22g066340 [Elsinoe fawcettii]
MSNRNVSVHTGFWINEAHGSTKGAVLTTSSNSANYLIAFMALYAAFTSTHAFGVLRFLFFYIRSSPSSQHGLHHQHQSTLRNRDSPGAIFWDAIRLWFEWRGKGRRAGRRSFGFAAFGLLCAVMYAAASIFSSLVTETRKSVLLERSPDCGTFEPLQNSYKGQLQSLDQSRIDIIWSNILTDSSRQALSCYELNQVRPSPSCFIYGRQLVTWKFKEVDTCPLGPGGCDRQNSAYRFESEYIDSLKHLGINTPLDDRVFLQMEQVCAPINVSTYVRGYPADNSSRYASQYWGSRSNVVALNLGDSRVGQPQIKGLNRNETASFAFWENGRPVTAVASSFNTPGNDYLLDPQFLEYRRGELSSSSFTPRDDISWLRIQDGKVSLLVLANGNIYGEQVFDPWFRADLSVNDMWFSSQVVRVVGCVNRQVICPTNKLDDDRCVASPEVDDAAMSAFVKEQSTIFTPGQLKVIPRLVRSFDASNPYRVAQNIKLQGLLASQIVAQGASEWVPANQWFKELAHMFNIALIAGQAMSIEWASKLQHLNISHAAPTPDEASMCAQQMLSSSRDYESFSLLGFCLLLILGFLAIVVDMALPTILETVPPHGGLKDYRVRDWTFQHFFQQQRHTYESNGRGTWFGTKKIPIIQKDERVRTPLDILGVSEEDAKCIKSDASRSGSSSDDSSVASIVERPENSWTAAIPLSFIRRDQRSATLPY